MSDTPGYEEHDVETLESEAPAESLPEPPPGRAAVEPALLRRIVEGTLLAAGKPMTVPELAALFDDDERPANDAIRAALATIAEESAGRGFELKEVASGFRFQVVQDVAPWIARLWEEKPQKYSRALLETLALIAYRQPITRGDIEDIRGVAVASNIVKTLLEREWVRIVGHKDVPGRPAMYATTRKFLDYFDLKNLDELPSLAEIRDLDSFNTELSLEGADTVTPEMGEVEGDDSEGMSADTAESAEDIPAMEASATDTDEPLPHESPAVATDPDSADRATPTEPAADNDDLPPG